MAECACGCGGRLDPLDGRGRPRRFLHGHNVARVPKPWKRKEVVGARRSREVAHERKGSGPCSLEGLGGCSRRIEVHHVDGNPLNNDPANITPLCGSHHKLVENGRIDLAAPRPVRYRVGADGKRRYDWSRV